MSLITENQRRITNLRATLAAGNNLSKTNFNGTDSVDGATLNIPGSTEGGIMRIPGLRNVELKRLIADLGDASDWELHLVSKDADGDELDVIIHSKASYGSNYIYITSEVGAAIYWSQSYGEYIYFTTTGATTDLKINAILRGH